MRYTPDILNVTHRQLKIKETPVYIPLYHKTKLQFSNCQHLKLKLDPNDEIAFDNVENIVGKG